MRLVAVGDLALRPLSASLRRVSTLEAVETQSFRRQTLDALLDVGVDEDVAAARLMDAAANTADASRLLFRRRRSEPLSVGRRRKWCSRRHRRRGNLRRCRCFCCDAAI